VSELVLFERLGAVAVLTLNRPEKRNALSLSLWAALERHLETIETDDEDIAVVVLKAAGPVFCAGNDLKERKIELPRPNYQNSIITRLANLKQPVIIAVQGGCFTGGLELALAADVLLAGRGASFADTHGKYGLVPIWGMSQRLPRRVGTWKAREMSMTGDAVSGVEAERIGLANRCVPDAELEETAMAMAHRIADQSRHSVLAYKRLYREQADLDLKSGLAHEVFRSPGPAPDAAERVGGFNKAS
jgi:enoyl-CoA hydratase